MKCPCEECLTLSLCRYKYTLTSPAGKKFLRLSRIIDGCLLVKNYYYEPATNTITRLHTLRELLVYNKVKT